MEDNGISKLVKLADALVYEISGKHLEDVEKSILWQALSGKQLKDILVEGYQPKYIWRKRAPKLWKELSKATGERVHIRNVQRILQKLQRERSPVGAVLQSLAGAKALELNGYVVVNGSSSCHNSVHLNSGSGCYAQLPNHVRGLFEADRSEKQKAEGNSSQPPEPTAAQFQSSDRTYHSDNSDCSNNSGETNSSTHSCHTFMFSKTGLPLLLSLAICSCGFGLSWLANWYGAKSHLAGNLPQAELNYRLALTFNPWSSAAAHYNLGAIYEDQNNYQRAHAEYQLAIEGGLVAAYNNQARLYLLEGKYDTSVSLLQIGLPMTKNEDKRIRYSFLKNLGWARLGQGRVEEAEVALNEAIAHESDDAAAHCLLAQVLEKREKEKEVLKEWENCLRYAQSQIPEEDKWMRLAQQRLKAAQEKK